MNKGIKMTRRELVWETRVNYFGEKEWKNLLAWLKTFTEKEPRDSWDKERIDDYNRLKDLTWDEVLEDYHRWKENDDAECIRWEVKHKGYDWDENANRVRNPEKDWTVTTYLGEYLHEMIREDNYNSDVEDCDYADDYEEDIEFVEYE